MSTETPPVYYDIVIIGSGIACTSSLRQLLDRLQKNEKPAAPLRISVIEKDREFWTGLPYGCRSSVNSLTITTLGEFIHPEDKKDFISWLESGQIGWMEHIRRNGGAPAAAWIYNNAGIIAAHQWDELYIPRFLYGNYLKEKISTAIETTGRLGIATVQLITAEVIDLIPESGSPSKGASLSNASYKVILEHKDGSTGTLGAGKVLLTIGSPPVKYIPAPAPGTDPGKERRQPDYLSVNDTYAPGLEENLKAIGTALSAITDREKRNILVMGSNASSLELLYMINYRTELRDLINQICVISYSGLLPHRITPNEHPDYHFRHLLALKEKRIFTADELITTIEQDVAIAYGKGVHIGDTYYQLSDLVVELQGLLDWDQQKRFSNIHGMRFTKLIRRAGAEYRDAAEELSSRGKLEMVRGKFLELVAAGDHAVQARYTSLPEGKTLLYPLPFAGVLNCGGFEDLPQSSSRIISNLIARKICKVNSTDRGFEVNENLEAAPNLFINGPLLGGIFNKQLRLWHVENAKRIHTLALLLAEFLSNQ
ncbi:MAG: FAD/NAD(P)-binding protein [Puia sp.]|nr:FAD/NAD(P)-binding protein [Puia sp.]